MPARAPTFHGSNEMKKSLLVAGIVSISSVLGSFGCDEVPGDAGTSGAAGSGSTTTTEQDPFSVGTPFDVPVPDSGRVFVDLDKPALVKEIDNWDLAFEGPDVYTNGGDSGIGKGAAFGPVDINDFLS